MAKLLKDLSDLDCFLGCYVECAEFCLCGGEHDVFDDLGDCENGAVVPGAAAGFWFAEIAWVAVDGKYLVAD